MVLVSFSVIVKLCYKEEGTFWLTSVYCPNNSNLRKKIVVGASRPCWTNFSRMVCRCGLQCHEKGVWRNWVVLG